MQDRTLNVQGTAALDGDEKSRASRRHIDRAAGDAGARTGGAADQTTRIDVLDTAAIVLDIIQGCSLDIKMPPLNTRRMQPIRRPAR